jgi:hypothetical protein
MDIQKAFDEAETKMAWDVARQLMFKAFDTGKMLKVPEHFILAMAQDTYFNQNGVHADATIKAYFDEWKNKA